jgi:hypothetical protein
LEKNNILGSEEQMGEIWVKKGLVFGMIWLIIGATMCCATGAPRSCPLEKNVLNSLKLYYDQEQRHLYQSLNTSLGLYGIVSSSGTGHAIHLLLKTPHIRNSKGFFIAGVILYTGLTALTTVWQLTNGTNIKIVDIGVGPHIVIFIGFGYSMFKRNIKGGAGKIIGVTVIKPLIFP